VNRDRHDPRTWNVVTDEKGRIVGKVQSLSPLLREQISVVKEFLIRLQKGQFEEMSKQQSQTKNENCNMVFLAGVLKFDPKVYENNVKALVDVGTKIAIQVSVYSGEKAPEGSGALANKLSRYKQGDFIKLVAMIRPYGVKQEDDSWKNSISIDVTEIKNEPPQRQSRNNNVSDDDIPF